MDGPLFRSEPKEGAHGYYASIPNALPKENGGNELKCAACSRKAHDNTYCELHARAYERIIETYDRWKRAMEISWKEYLSEIAKNPLTGEWAREVAEQLIKAEKEVDVENG